jgi:signal transduction histidine kinase
MTRRTALAIALIGAVATASAAGAFSMSATEALELSAIVVGSVGASGVVGVLVLFALRRRSTALQASAVALITLAAVGVGAIVAANAMFLTKHDLDAFLVILLAAGTVGSLVAYTLGRRVRTGTASLGETTRRIGDGHLGGRIPPPEPAELATLAGELEAMSKRLDEARGRERSLEASRRELITWVSHDLRTPLAGLRAVAEALEDGLAPDEETRARYFRALRDETERLAHLVDELFELSVIQSGALRLQMERTLLGDLVSDAIAAASLAARTKGVRVDGSVNGPVLELDLSPLEIGRVLRNLLENAIRHTPSDGSVWVESGIEDDGAYVSVADECGGIPEPDLRRVFDPSFRGEAARTPRPDGGAGLGLAIARGIIEAHHGDISVRNEGAGCRFTVRLPLTRSA